MAVVYRHRRSDNNSIFYIGIGLKKERAYQKRSRNKHWHNIVNKIDYNVEIICEDIEYEDAKELEILLIKMYGRKDLGLGLLCNNTDGGDGNVNMSEETKEKISNSLKGRKISEDIIKKRSNTQKEIWNSKEFEEKRKIQSDRAKINHLNGKISRKGVESKKKGIPLSQEIKDKVSKGLKEYYKNNKSHSYKHIDFNICNDIFYKYTCGVSIYRLHKDYGFSRNLIKRIIKENK
jgi:hypothetical protein